MRGLRARKRRAAGTRRLGKRARPAPLRTFELHLDLLRAYAARKGHSRVPVAHREGNFCLGRWVTRCRSRYRAGELSPERIRTLERMPGWTWDPLEERFQEGLRALLAFVKREGHSRVPDRHREAGFALGSWVRSRREGHRLGWLSLPRVAALERLPGWSWRCQEDDFQEGLRLLREFVRREGHARVPDRYQESGFALGTWVRTRRREYRVGCLSPQRMRLLGRLSGWRWDHWDGEFNAGLRRAKQFVRREGHACVPARHYEGPFPLGSWINNRRAQYRRGNLALKRARALGALPGWKWRVGRRAHRFNSRSRLRP